MDPGLLPPEDDPPQQEAAKKGSTPHPHFYTFYGFRIIECLDGRIGFLHYRWFCSVIPEKNVYRDKLSPKIIGLTRIIQLRKNRLQNCTCSHGCDHFPIRKPFTLTYKRLPPPASSLDRSLQSLAGEKLALTLCDNKHSSSVCQTPVSFLPPVPLSCLRNLTYILYKKSSYDMMLTSEHVIGLESTW